MIKFKVRAMTCAHCVEIITRVIYETVPQAHVHIDLPKRLVYVEGTTELALLKRVIRELGYTPVHQKTDSDSDI